VRSRWTLCAVVGAVLVAAGASPAPAGNGYGQQKAALDAKLAAVQAKVAQARAREARLDSEVGRLDARIGALESRASDMASRMSALRADLGLRRRRIDVLNALYRVQSARARDLQHAYRLELTRLDQRLVAVYESPDPTTLDLVLQAKSFQDIVDQVDYLGRVAQENRSIVAQVAHARDRVTAARAKTAKVRRRIANAANVIRARLEQVQVIDNELLTTKHTLSSARARTSVAYLLARSQEQSAVKESAAIQAASAAIEAKIKASQSGGDTPSAVSASGAAATPSEAGLIWPVTGPITSPFGPRWGGFHPGIDIGVPTGTPIHAAAAGTVIWCGWETGYGNLVVIDHHDGLATAYAHQSKIAVSCNQDVAQGQVIGYVGCTGVCTGPHLHFEVRVNGTPVDPLGYLP